MYGLYSKFLTTFITIIPFFHIGNRGNNMDIKISEELFKDLLKYHLSSEDKSENAAKLWNTLLSKAQEIKAEYPDFEFKAEIPETVK